MITDTERVDKRTAACGKHLNHDLRFSWIMTCLLLTVGMLVVAGIVVLVLLLLVAAELLLEASGAVEFILMEILASIVTELLCPAPKVKREPAERNINSC